jgi:hypothetical protein
MPKRKNPPEKPKDQFKRFLETAKEQQVNESDAEEAFKAISVRPSASSPSASSSQKTTRRR